MAKLRKAFALMASAASVALASCGQGKPKIPEIGEDLTQSALEGQEAFDERIKDRFAIGSPVDLMVSELRKQGFEESTFEKEKFRTLDYRNDRFPVHTLWSVRWREEQGKITEIWGVFGHTGP
ncbi:hypothetical protein [Altererythrobacter xiamenensis]|uniref:hypothetical protein n=1 Tax=Altererythrobacter xiamenensis TaxID=1316679 RepID=UPI0011789DE6|nr:hypothetical protein [Altererythrobacter xiamenensis]